MQQYKVLILTDHSHHSIENAVYAFANIMQEHPLCDHLGIATRGNVKNDIFFKNMATDKLQVAQVGDDFAFDTLGRFFYKNVSQKSIGDYDLIWLRLPPPLSRPFLTFLKKVCSPKQVIINAPEGIYLTGSKEFLMNFLDLCPPMRVCRSVQDIVDFKKQFSIVLKPFREYGGKGIVRIEGEKVWIGKQLMTFDEFTSQLPPDEIAYLGVKFLKNVTEGDKRIVVINGKIMGASLRMPAKGSWLCNVAMGGTAIHTKVTESEKYIIRRINPKLSRMGIVMYGVDTLMGDDGKRVLSEINTTSIGGLPQMAQFTGKPLVEETIDLIWQYYLAEKNTNDFKNRR